MRANNLIAQCVSILFLLVSISSIAQENSLSNLQAQGKLKITAAIAQANNTDVSTINLVPKQQVTLKVEVFSTYPFNDNYTLPYFDVDNAIVTPPNDKATLDIQIIEDQQWFVQRKEISLYPLKGGSYTVPSLMATVFINLENNKVVSGTISSEPINFNVNLPAELHGVKNFIASEQVSFTLKKKGAQTKKQTIQSTNNQQLSDSISYDIGSAVSFTYTLKADNMHVIMLDKLTLPNIDGVQIYQKPAIEKDVFDRFEKFNTAVLTQSFTFIFQQKGLITIPAQHFTWWDLKHKKVKEIRIKAQQFTVGNGAVSNNNGSSLTNNTFVNFIKSSVAKLFADKNTIIYGMIILAVIIFGTALTRKILLHRNALLSSLHKMNKTRQKQLTSDFIHQITNNNYQEALNSLYGLTKQLSGSVTPLSMVIDTENQARLHSLQQLAFTSEATQTLIFTEKDAQLLLTSIMKKHSHEEKKESFNFSMELNPEKVNQNHR